MSIEWVCHGFVGTFDVMKECKSVAEVARDLDLTETTFRRWVEQARTDKS
jgi:transposase-like protein